MVDVGFRHVSGHLIHKGVGHEAPTRSRGPRWGRGQAFACRTVLFFQRALAMAFACFRKR